MIEEQHGPDKQGDRPRNHHPTELQRENQHGFINALGRTNHEIVLFRNLAAQQE